jgi:2-polyprenyl-3-methyl-5-hydroxy-6-metoxy-1,4-benzoquinol methylase
MTANRTCPACGGRTFLDGTPVAALTTHTCRTCGLVLATIPPTDDPVPEFALVDELTYLRSVGTVRRRQARAILAMLARHVRPGARLLDVGCSFGFFLLEARRAGFRVEGLEPDPQAIERARAVLGDDIVRRGRFSAATAPREEIDVLCTLDVIEHIEPAELDGFAELVEEALRPGGIWVVKVPTTEGLYYTLSHLIARVAPGVGSTLIQRLWQTRYEFPHLVYFSRRSLSTWLERRGFDVVDHRYLQEVPNDTVVDRLTTDHDIGRPLALLLVPAVIGINVVEAIRGRSDSLVVLARPRAR